MLSTLKPLLPVLGFCFLLSAFNVPRSFGQHISASDDPKVNHVAGRATYNSACAGCHGLDGRGSDKAINISGSEQIRHLSDAQLTDIISNGVAGTGMPAFHTLSERQIRGVVGYLRTLQGKGDARNLPGNARSGKEVFFGKGQCSSCHTISGEGGFLGPDLSGYGAGVPSKEIRDEIVRSQRVPPQGYRQALLVNNAGDRLEGIVRNEDNFSIQFQTKDGAFHFFQKSELRSLDRLDASLMPTNYGERLSAGELDDLVSYLMTVSPNASKATKPHKEEDDTE